MFGKPVKSDAIVIWVCVLLTAACLLLWLGFGLFLFMLDRFQKWRAKNTRKKLKKQMLEQV